jgi:two-component system phosphate regulon response regulator PhoB
MSRKKALILEEDEEFRSILAEEVRGAGLEVMAFGDPSTLLQEFSSSPSDLVVTDAKIPELPLEEFLGRLHSVARSGFRVLVIAGPGAQSHGIPGIRAGQDEVIPKPIERMHFRERIRTLTGNSPTGTGKLGVGGLLVDPRSYDVFLMGERVHLTPNEFKLLEALLVARGGVLSRDELIRQVQGPGIAVIDRAIDTHVFSLRKKLGAEGARIETVRGEGYRIRI